ncbi:MAG TPA: chromosome segregation protein SMC [Acidimicrobiales bacterium]|nr:chromosome segregation protein SMC [Acidimicrobiales bacterium]
MYLKNLTLKGFKSFADTTGLALEPGITVVVGPNGSGKSNVVDAVAWVLGAQGPRTLRSTKMDDVIFAGTADRPALGRAEVSLTIDNASGMLPIEFPEVTITRTLFRDGVSEYAVNRVPCRLLDIQELLSDSGVGRTQHVIVGQGQLGAVLEARPEERRAIIEEAAGVLKYRRRKEKAERRLAATEGNLVRLSDLAREVRRQLKPLERQAEAARRHEGVVSELRAIRLHLAGKELATLAARVRASEETQARLGRADAAARAELRGLDADVEASEHRLAAAGDADVTQVLGRAERLREQARGLVAVLGERRRGAIQARTAALDETVVATLEAEATTLRNELDEVEAEARRLAPELARLAEAEASLRRHRPAVGAEPPAGSTDPARRAADARAERRARIATTERLDEERARARARLTRLEQRDAGLAIEAGELAERRRRVDADHHLAGATLAAAGEEVAAAEAALAEAQERLRAADAERHGWIARAGVLEAAIDEARARAGAHRLAGVAEVAGTLVELVDVDAGWEAAFEAAAGAALAAVVVRGGEDGARRCLEHLRREGSGTVLALGPGATPPPATLPAGAERVRDHVQPRQAGAGPLLDRLLGTAVCVGGAGEQAWRAALEVATAQPGAVVVTRAGDRFAVDGWRVGRGATGASRGALDEARERAGAAAVESRRAEERCQQGRARLDHARRLQADAARTHQDQAGELRALAEAEQRVGRQAATTAEEATEVGRHLDDLVVSLVAEREQLRRLEALLPALEADEAGSLEQHRRAEAERRQVEDQLADAAARRRHAEARARALEERRVWLQQRRDQVDARLAGDGARRARACSRRAPSPARREQARARRVELDRRVADLDRLAALVAARLAWLDETLDRLRRRRQVQAEATRAEVEHLERLRHGRRAAEQRLEEVREQSVRAGMEAQELGLRVEAATEALRRDLDVEPGAAFDAPCPPLPEGVTPRARARELERDLRLMGPVNPLALEEAAALRERQEFLDGQLDDVKSSRRELAKVIRSVDAEIVDVFVAAFADVAENFSRLFSVLFPGGTGTLELTDPAHPLETGIRVHARPSGKNVRSLSLLSGGERSLTALAYLFAVFRSRPSPFYILDEVEAALDDVNLHRFVDLVGEFRREAQLVIVTHQQRTMETADVLYGVTMAPGGASRVVSERLSGAVV